MARPRNVSRLYSSEANAYFARLATKPTPQRRDAYQFLIGSLVGAGVWAKLDALWVLAAADAATAAVNLKSSSYALSLVSTPTFTADRGYTGNGSSTALSTGYNPGAGGTLYAQDSASLFGWSLTAGQVGAFNANNSMMGVAGGVSDSFIYPRDTSDTYRARVNQTGSIGLTVTNALGFFVATRTAAAAGATYAYSNSAFSQTNTTTGASVAVKNATWRLLGTDLGFWAGQMAVAGAGGALTRADSDALFAACQHYLRHAGAI